MKKTKDPLSRREREIMDVLYRAGQATASQIVGELAGSPSNSSVRTILRILEEKGHIDHVRDGQTYVYRPRVNRERAGRSALKHLLSTFFDDSPEAVVSTLLDEQSGNLSKEELDSLAALIDRVRKEGR